MTPGSGIELRPHWWEGERSHHCVPLKKESELFLCAFSPLNPMNVVVAEWSRRWTRNPLASPRAGSNPAHYVKENFLVFQSQRTYFYTRAIIIDPTGL